MTDFEREDMELQSVMGGKFVDVTTQISNSKPVMDKLNETAQNPVTKPDTQKPVLKTESEWQPVKPKNNLAECAKSTLIYGGLNALILYWQIEGLMADSIALPCMLVCAALAGWSIGKAFGGEK